MCPVPPTSSRDFHQAALQRLEAAQCLLFGKFNLDAHYLGGYTIECSLKALILKVTPDGDRAEMLRRITSGARMHRFEVLVGLLREMGLALPLVIAKRRRLFEWTTELRYETGRRDTGETTAFLKTARSI